MRIRGGICASCQEIIVVGKPFSWMNGLKYHTHCKQLRKAGQMLRRAAYEKNKLDMEAMIKPDKEGEL